MIKDFFKKKGKGKKKISAFQHKFLQFVEIKNNVTLKFDGTTSTNTLEDASLSFINGSLCDL